MNIGWVILILIVVVLILWFIHKHFKALKLPNVYLISGAVKSGKSLLSVHLAVKQYRKAMRRYKIKSIVAILFRKDKPEKPMLYSNMHLRYVKYNLMTIDIINRKVRLPYGSVVLIDEASLVADSMLFKDQIINQKLMLFVKLFAHYTRGGYLILNTQSVSDLHFAFKRCVGQYLYISDRTKYPFLTMFNVREMIYNDEGNITNNVNEDKDLSMRKIFAFNRCYKYYDPYCYSVFTDKKPLFVNYDQEIKGKHDSLKTNILITLQDFDELKEFIKNENE